MGIFCSIVVYPVVPKGQIMLRIIPTSAHSLEDVEYTMNQFEVVQKRLADGFYKAQAEQFKSVLA
jgi:glycine C-acetyltransferase